MKKSIILLGIALSVFTQNGCAERTTNASHHRQQNVEHRFSDAEITTMVKEKYIAEKLFGDRDISAFSISVTTVDGIVHLTGKAKNAQQLMNAIHLAKTTRGVLGVVTDVKIKS